jgi:DinB superfamily
MSPSATESLVPELEDLRKQIDFIVADAQKLTAGISDGQFNWQPEPGRWSMAQCLVHLNLAAAIQLPRVEAGIRAARAQGLVGQGPYRRGIIGTLIVRLTEPPPKIRFKAPKSMAPPPAESLPRVGASFLELQGRLQEQIRHANGVDLGRAKVASPVADWLRFTLGQTLMVIAAHERRHLWQAWQIRNDSQFPQS